MFGAISLNQAISTLLLAFQKPVSQSIFSGFSLSPNSIKSRKNLQYQLNHILASLTDIVIWHNAVNNSISRRRSNSFKTLSDTELRGIIIRFENQIEAIVFYQC